ncbi:MAG: Ig-like domain-containing protein [Oscillospiraceae bacterium]
MGEDGAFTHTPKKNKVGKDSFSFTATDEAGAVSNEATVTIEILKPLDNTTIRT